MTNSYRAHDLEKRQHLFGHGIIAPLPPNRVGLFGCGSGRDITPAVVKAEKEIERKWSARPVYQPIDVVDDYSRPMGDYPDTPPTYDEATGSVGSASASAVPSGSSAARRVPPALPPRHEKVPGAF
jgi:hypothetical protein